MRFTVCCFNVERIHFRRNNYTSSQRHLLAGETPKPKYFHKHYLRDSHHGLLEVCEVRLIYKIDLSDSIRTEFFWMGHLKTVPQFGFKGEVKF